MPGGWQWVGIAIDRSPCAAERREPDISARKKTRGSLLFRAEEFHLKPRIEGIPDRFPPAGRPAVDIGIVRAGKACRGFTFDLICLVYLASPMNGTAPTSQWWTIVPEIGEGFWASGRRTKGDNVGDRTGITLTGQKQSAPNQPRIFFSLHRPPKVPRRRVRARISPS